MKKWITFFLAMFLLVPTALAAEEEFPYRTSDWAREEVSRSVELDLIYDPYDYLSKTPFPGRILPATRPPWWPRALVSIWRAIPSS